MDKPKAFLQIAAFYKDKELNSEEYPISDFEDIKKLQKISLFPLDDKIMAGLRSEHYYILKFNQDNHRLRIVYNIKEVL